MSSLDPVLISWFINFGLTKILESIFLLSFANRCERYVMIQVDECLIVHFITYRKYLSILRRVLRFFIRYHGTKIEYKIKFWSKWMSWQQVSNEKFEILLSLCDSVKTKRTVDNQITDIIFIRNWIRQIAV